VRLRGWGKGIGWRAVAVVGGGVWFSMFVKYWRLVLVAAGLAAGQRKSISCRPASPQQVQCCEGSRIIPAPLEPAPSPTSPDSSLSLSTFHPLPLLHHPSSQARTSPSGLPSSQWCRCCGNQLQRRQQPPATAAKHTPHTDDRGTSDRFWQPASRAPEIMPWLHVLWWRPPAPLRTALQQAPTATTLQPRSDPFCAIPLALL
jgi:hypothetical protein